MLTTEVTFNSEQQLYVIPCGGGFSCLGYQVCYDKSYALRAWLIAMDRPIPGPIPSEPMERYNNYQQLMDAARSHCDANGIRCSIELHPQLSGLEGKRVKVTYNESHKDWGLPQRFIVGKSTGWMPIHLEIKTKRSSGGGAISHDIPFKTVEVIG